MSIAAKKKIVYACLVLLTLWPAVHISLAKRYEMSPWKLAGWGMYAAPQLDPIVHLECLTPDEVGRYELGTVLPEWEREFEDFVRRRRGLGHLARPDALGLKLLQLYPAILGVEITVERPWLNRRTGMIESRSTTYRYGRR